MKIDQSICNDWGLSGVEKLHQSVWYSSNRLPLRAASLNLWCRRVFCCCFPFPSYVALHLPPRCAHTLRFNGDCLSPLAVVPPTSLVRSQLEDGSPRPPEATRPSQEPLTCVAHKFQPSHRANQRLSRSRNHIWSLPEAYCDLLNVIAHNNSMINRTEIWRFVAAGYIEVVLGSVCSMLWLSEAVPALCHVLIDQWEVPHYVCIYVFIYVYDEHSQSYANPPHTSHWQVSIHSCA